MFNDINISCRVICLQVGYWVNNNIFVGYFSRQNYDVFGDTGFLSSLLLVMQVNPDGTIINYNYKLLDYKAHTSLMGVELNSFRVIKEETTIDDVTYGITIRVAGYDNKNSSTSTILYDTIYIGVEEEVIAIKYQNKIYYNSQVESLTAGQPDVRAGKTFIGYMGYVEEGTMEVE